MLNECNMRNEFMVAFYEGMVELRGMDGYSELGRIVRCDTCMQ